MADEIVAAPVAAPAAAPVATPATPVAAAPAAAPAASPAAAPAAPEPVGNLFDEPAEGEAKPAEAKPEDETKKPEEAAPVKPEDYTFKLPEGASLSDEELSGVRAVLAEAGVPTDRAQPLFDKFVAGVQAASKATLDGASQKWSDMQRGWQAEVKGDADIGGAKLQPAIADTRKGAQSLLGAEGAKAMFDALNFTGAGNHPAIVKALHKAFSPHASGKPVNGQPVGSTGKSAAQTLYGNSTPALGNSALNP